MRVLLADVASTDGFVHKDTIAGGYGSRLRPFSTVTWAAAVLKRRLNDLPSVTLATLAAILDEAGHEVRFTRGRAEDADVALVLSSLVDHRGETRFADALRARGARVGFVGLAASTLPELFLPHADFVVAGEPEDAIGRLARGERLSGVCLSRAAADLDALPFPRWDLLGAVDRRGSRLVTRPRGGFPLLASRSCPEPCGYCPHRILARPRARSVGSVVGEIEALCAVRPHPFVIFRDPLFSGDRERVEALCDGIAERGLSLRFECETRLDRLDEDLLRRMRTAGLATLAFGVEAATDAPLAGSGRRTTPRLHERRIVAACRRLGIRTVAFYVLGFPEETRADVLATIDYAAALRTTLAQFKLLTPYPGTPLYTRLRERLVESDWERFDGFTPTFAHPHLTAGELRGLLARAYARFYARPAFLGSAARLLAARAC